MSYLWKAEVSFTGVWRRTLDQAGVCRLPSGETTLPSMKVREVGTDQYLACLELESANLIDAKKNAVTKVEKLLQILATNNDLFEIDFSSISAEVISELTESNSDTPELQGDVGLKLEGQSFVFGHLSFQKQKAQLKFEDMALGLVDDWPIHLRRGLELNYSAVRAPSHSVGFLLSAATLEVLAWKKLGPPMSVLSTALNEPCKKKFKNEFKKFAGQWGFDENQINRLHSNLCNTNNLPVANHLRFYLESVGIGESVADISDLARWWALRGRLAHGEGVEQGDIQSDYNKLVIATQLALRQELTMLG